MSHWSARRRECSWPEPCSMRIGEQAPRTYGFSKVALLVLAGAPRVGRLDVRRILLQNQREVGDRVVEPACRA